MARVYVAGSINMDLVARAKRHPRPGETIAGATFATYPGGKGANQAVAAARLGANTVMIARLGGDTFGAELSDFLRTEGVGLDHVQRTETERTGVALIVVSDSGENSIVVVPGANDLLGPEDVQHLDIASNDVALSQFEIPLTTVEVFFRSCRKLGARTILNPAPARSCSKSLLALADVLIVNETELAFFLETEPRQDLPPSKMFVDAQLLRTRADQIVVVTLGAQGVLALVNDREVLIPAHKVTAVDTTAAGDTFAGAVATRLASGDSIEESLRYANAAAAICVQRHGAGPSIPRDWEVQKLIAPTSVTNG